MHRSFLATKESNYLNLIYQIGVMSFFAVMIYVCRLVWHVQYVQGLFFPGLHLSGNKLQVVWFFLRIPVFLRLNLLGYKEWYCFHSQ